ncbi:vegetative cell wall protein gp1-like [Eucalyptus grandis]|uniref:vegetative cell wall protein gp1-like n=1 Tax=Eucalyptus grandis TaxID=71139 RepID=UPI00192F0065|nr:vegetative cell wall protein gp1-like [Eucalyptus grandis]
MSAIHPTPQQPAVAAPPQPRAPSPALPTSSCHRAALLSPASGAFAAHLRSPDVATAIPTTALPPSPTPRRCNTSAPPATPPIDLRAPPRLGTATSLVRSPPPRCATGLAAPSAFQPDARNLHCSRANATPAASATHSPLPNTQPPPRCCPCRDPTPPEPPLPLLAGVPRR